MKMFSTIYHDDGLLPFWLKYYESRGVDCFILAVHPSAGNIEKQLGTYNRIVEPMHGKYAGGIIDTLVLKGLISKYSARGEWVMIADVDEFHYKDGVANFNELKSDDYDWIEGEFVDRVAECGLLTEIKPEQSLCSQYPMQAALTSGLLRGGCGKVVMFRSGFDLFSGHHWAIDARKAKVTCETHHFKWHGKKLVEWLTERTQIPYYQASSESVIFLNHYVQHGNKIKIQDFDSKPATDIGI